MKLFKSMLKVLKEALIALFNLLFPSENIVDVPDKKAMKVFIISLIVLILGALLFYVFC